MIGTRECEEARFDEQSGGQSASPVRSRNGSNTWTDTLGLVDRILRQQEKGRHWIFISITFIPDKGVEDVARLADVEGRRGLARVDLPRGIIDGVGEAVRHCARF